MLNTNDSPNSSDADVVASPPKARPPREAIYVLAGRLGCSLSVAEKILTRGPQAAKSLTHQERAPALLRELGFGVGREIA